MDPLYPAAHAVVYWSLLSAQSKLHHGRSLRDDALCRSQSAPNTLCKSMVHCGLEPLSKSKGTFTFSTSQSTDGATVGTELGSDVGGSVGTPCGLRVGDAVGAADGSADGDPEGVIVGEFVGKSLGRHSNIKMRDVPPFVVRLNSNGVFSGGHTPNR